MVKKRRKSETPAVDPWPRVRHLEDALKQEADNRAIAMRGLNQDLTSRFDSEIKSLRMHNQTNISMLKTLTEEMRLVVNEIINIKEQIPSFPKAIQEELELRVNTAERNIEHLTKHAVSKKRLWSW